MAAEDYSEPLLQAFAEIIRARDVGQSPSREEFLRRYPQLADQLAELLDAADLIAEFTQQASGAQPVPGTSLPSDLTRPSQERTVLAGGQHETLPPQPREDDESTHGLKLPHEFGEYVLERVLGFGGMGVVYLARQVALDRQVALKMIRSGALAGSEEIQRFLAEARAAARLQHPQIVSVHHGGQLQGHHYFVMEYVPGTDLARKLREGTLAPREAAAYVADVADAIEYAHSRGLLHRDLKPANVLIDEKNRVRVTDFGLAKQIGGERGLTRSGTTMGTPSYMAPEQAAGDSQGATPATDVYAMGAILFALLTGRPPFQHESAVQTMLQVVHQPAPLLRMLRPDAPRDLETIVAKCLEKAPAKRYQTARELAEELRRFIANKPILARPRSIFERAGTSLQRIPVLAALSGRRLIEVNERDRRLQWVLLLSMAVIPLLGAAAIPTLRWYRNLLPRHIVVGGGWAGGAYQQIADGLAARIAERTGRLSTVTPSSGSLDNLQRLQNGDLDLALLQASAVRGDDIALIAPVFHEAVHFLVRPGRQIQQLSDLVGHRLAVGPKASASRLAAEMLLDDLPDEQSKKIVRDDRPWDEVLSDQGIDAALICVGRRTAMINRLLGEGRFQLMPLTDASDQAIRHPNFNVLSIQTSDYPQATLPQQGVVTVGTTSFLVARFNAPDELVSVALDALYLDPPLAPAMITRDQAAEWQGLALHPAARRYFSRVLAEIP